MANFATIKVNDNGEWDLSTILYDDDAIIQAMITTLREIKGDNFWNTEIGLSSFELLESSDRDFVRIILNQMASVGGVVETSFDGIKEENNIRYANFSYKTINTGIYQASIKL